MKCLDILELKFLEFQFSAEDLRMKWTRDQITKILKKHLFGVNKPGFSLSIHSRGKILIVQ